MYLIIKSLHIISVITWMAGLLYLPRLFVYHSLSETNSIQSETFKIMERKLLKAIMLPSIIFVFGSGLLMVYLNYFLIYELYFQIKVILVLIMGYIHGMYSRMYKEFENDNRNKTDTYYRIWNEVPACIMIIIVLLIITKPF